MKKNIRYAFTLVELIVVITILAILGTIAIVYFDEYVWGARDATRIADITQITTNLEVYLTQNGELPDPSNGVSVTYSGALAWTQGTFWAEVLQQIRDLWQNIPVDPLYDNEYTYSVTSTKKEYQIAGIREDLEEEEWLWELVMDNIVPQASAYSIETAYVRWNYNGFMVKAGNNDQVYFIATPSIISYDPLSSDALDIITSQKLVYDQFFNLPGSYESHLDVDGGFDFNVTNPLVYSGGIDDLKDEGVLLELNEQLKYVYATTPTESFDRYVLLLDREWLTGLKEFLTKVFKIPFQTYFNCKDILDAGYAEGDTFYTIDPDGAWWKDPYQVFCDMTTDGGGWTRVWDNHITNGNFSTGSWILNAIENSSDTHEIVSLPVPIDENDYALHQTGNYSSNYEVTFDDPSVIKPSYEIRMSLWRSDYGSGDIWGWVDETKILWGKNNPWTIGSCTDGTRKPSCELVGFNKKMQNSANFWPWGKLTEIDFSVVDPVDTVTTNYLNWGILFDGFTPSSGSYGYWVWGTYYNYTTYSELEKQAIDEWIQAWGFLIATNDENDFDPLGEYYWLSTEEYDSNGNVVNQWVNGEQWVIENINHPIVNGSIGLKKNWSWIDLRWQTLIGQYRRSALSGYVWPEDIVLAKENRPPYTPTVILRKHGKWHILITSGDGIFKDMNPNTNTFDTNDNETVFAAALMAYAIETAANINPHEWYVFHNRIYYNDGTFSTNGEDEILETVTIDDNGTPRTWYHEQTRHKVYKTPESFSWHIWLDANNNKDLYYTGVRLELFYR